MRGLPAESYQRQRRPVSAGGRVAEEGGQDAEAGRERPTSG